MPAVKLTQRVRDGGIFIPLEGLDNQVIKIEVNTNSITESEKSKNAASIAQSFFSKISKNSTIDLEELNVYKQ